MSLKKDRDFRFTFQDASGKFRVVHIQAQHFQESGEDKIKLQATTDGIPIETSVFVDEGLSTRIVKTRTEL